MRNLAIVLVAVLVITGSALSQYSISGSIAGGSGGLYLKVAVGVPTVGGSYYYTVASLGSYSLSNMAAGEYIVFAFQDLNWNLFPDYGDPSGYYNGSQVVPITIPPNRSGINITLVVPPNTRFTGTIYYNGTLTGATIMKAYNNPDFSGNPVRIDLVRDTTGHGTGPYEFRINPGTYYFRTHMDRNGDLEPNIGEPYVYYGSPGNPLPIVVTSGSWPSGINITLVEIPLLAVTQLTTERQGSDIVLRWNRIPFVQQYHVYRGTDPDMIPSGTPYASVSTNTWTDPSVVNSASRYFYIVTATDETVVR